MTTPERFRRRQRIEGVILLLLGAFTVVYTINDKQQDDDLLDCVVTTLSGQNDVLGAGREANRLENRAGEIEQQADERLISSALRGDITTPEAVQAASQRYDAAQVLADEKRALADEKRAENPVPPDPEEECR